MSEGGFLGSINQKWEGLLEWSDEKGIPLRSASDFFESKGIPPAPALIILLIALVAVVGFAAFSISGSQTSSIAVTVLDESGSPMGGVLVRVASLDNPASFELKEQYSDLLGKTVFTSLSGDSAMVSAVAQSVVFSPTKVEFEAAKESTVSLSAERLVEEKVTLSFAVSSAGGDLEESNVKAVLLDEFQNQVGELTGVSPKFDVKQNASYFVSVTAPGFSPKTSDKISVGTTNVFLPNPILLIPLEATPKVKITVFAYELAGSEKKPVASAKVSVDNALTYATIISSAQTGPDGRTGELELKKGVSAVIRVSAGSYLPKATNQFTAESDSTIEIALNKSGEQASDALQVLVKDEQENILQDALIVLYRGGVKESIGEKTDKPVAQFDLEKGGNYSVTVFSDGFLPQYFDKVKPGILSARLVKATAKNSGSLAVTAVDFEGKKVAQAQVAIKTGAGIPLGYPDIVTGLDGSVLFQGVPLVELTVLASQAGRSGQAGVKIIPSNNSVQVMLQKGVGSVRVRAYDYFNATKPAVKGAVITVGSSNCTTQGDGTCFLAVQETAGATLIASAAGFDRFESAQFSVSAAVQTEVDAPLISSSVAASTRLEFVGLLDANGKKVANSLSPNSAYKAVYLLRSPTFEFRKAEAFISIGDKERKLSDEIAWIAGFDGGVAKTVFAGESLSSGVLTKDNSSAYLLNSAGPQYKWAEFSYDPFAGVKEIRVNIATRAGTGKTTLNSRTAFRTGAEAFRNPADPAAGVSKSDLLANLESKPFEVSFAGECENEFCIKLFFQDGSISRGLKGFEGAAGDKLDLAFEAYAFNSSIELALTSEDNKVVKILGAQADGNEPRVSSSGSKDSIALSLKRGGKGSFSLHSLRASSSADLSLSAVTADGQNLFSKRIVFRIAASSSSKLLVKPTPSSLNALEQTAVSVAVTDSFKNPVSDALVFFSTSTPVQASEVSPGVYSAIVSPTSASPLEYSVDANGFSLFKSSILVSASSIIEPSKQSLSIQFNPTSVNDEISEDFTLSNLLESDASLSLDFTTSASPRLTKLSLNPEGGVAQLSSREQLSASLGAQLNSLASMLSKTSDSKGEELSGEVIVTARALSNTQILRIPFRLSTVFSTQKIDDAWSLETDSLSFSIDEAGAVTGQKTVKVSNNGPSTLAINHEFSQGLSVTPLSQLVEPGKTAEFSVQAKKLAGSQGGCYFDLASGGEGKKIDFVASSAGLISAKKSVSVQATLFGKAGCAPIQPVKVSVAGDFKFNLLGLKQLTNIDKTISVQLPDGTILQLPATAVVEQNTATAPESSNLVVDGTAVSVLPNGFSLTLPVDYSILFTPSAGISQVRGETVIVLGNSIVKAPSSATLSQTSDGYLLNVKAGAAIFSGGLPRVSIERTIALSIPVSAEYYFPPSAMVFQQIAGNIDVQYADESYSFGQGAQADINSVPGVKKIIAPANQVTRLPSSRVQKIGGNYKLSLPIQVILVAGFDSKPISIGGDKTLFL
ncbi:hypothetical protein HY993_00630, partial [Candidatus Micrarchaeota archaeon]|nr:hypothetical protein [Candidatus Micrarchaeota archaeon]